jgi:sigma-B regulation protein RsbU (phosphoserine phosphatase)
MQPTADDVLRAFRGDELRLFIAAASITIGLVAVAFSLIRQRFDRLLSFFAWFSALYGAQLWMQSSMHSLMAHPSPLLDKVQMALEFFVSIPAFQFFGVSGLVGRTGRVIVYLVCLVEMCLIGAIFLGLPLQLLDHLNSVCIIAGSVSLVILAFREPVVEKGSAVFRAGLLVFVGFVLWTNGALLLGHRTSIELYGFAVFLCCIGYVAAKRALERDLRLSSIQKELDVARRIQLSILPTAFPVSEHFTVAARYLPMTSVAGDFYEFIYTESGAVGLLIADVSGHGVPAALIASMVKVAIQSQRHHAANPDRLIAGVNEVLCGNTQNQFVTAAYAYLDPDCGELCYAAAGHPPMLLLREGQISQVEENGLVLALSSSAIYTSTKRPLLKGDRLLLYTDGVVEAANADEEEFGHERLSSLLRTSENMTAEEAADLILNTVRGWSSAQADDLTVLVCDYKRNP